jgi:SEC-C motif-containing protein
MRSRYSAYVVRDEAYLLKSWHASTRPATIGLDRELRWTGLEILGSTDGSVFHSEGTVEFVAGYVDHGTPGSLRENSLFQRENGAWVYVRAL